MNEEKLVNIFLLTWNNQAKRESLVKYLSLASACSQDSSDEAAGGQREQGDRAQRGKQGLRDKMDPYKCEELNNIFESRTVLQF